MREGKAGCCCAVDEEDEEEDREHNSIETKTTILLTETTTTTPVTLLCGARPFGRVGGCGTGVHYMIQNGHSLSLSSLVVVIRRSSRGVGPRNEVREKRSTPARQGKALAEQSATLSRPLGQGQAERRGEEEEDRKLRRESHRGRRRRSSSRGRRLVLTRAGRATSPR